MTIITELQLYIESILIRNKSNAELDINSQDLAQEVLQNNSVNLVDAKAIVRNRLIVERRKLKAAKQKAGVLPKYPRRKTCHSCNKDLPASEFMKCTDHKSGMTYISYRCNPCRSKSRREIYANNPHQKELARQRYLRFKAKKQAS